MFKHILVPTDGSPLSQDAVRNAVSFAKDTGARITAVHAKQIYRPGHHVEGTQIAPEILRKLDETTEAESKEILEFVEKLCKDANVECATLSRKTHEPYKAIIEAAIERGCDLIFMASHGRSGIGALLLGSETSKVLTHSKIPVMVYR